MSSCLQSLCHPAFSHYAILPSVIMSSCLQSLCHPVFSHYAILPSVIMPSCLQSLCHPAFSHCVILPSVIMPSCLQSLCHPAFSHYAILPSVIKSSCLQHRKKQIKVGEKWNVFIGACLTVYWGIIILCNRSADLRLQFLMQYSSNSYLVCYVFSWQCSSLS